MKLLTKVQNILVCPSCMGKLVFETNKICCKNCSVIGKIHNDKLYFIQVKEFETKEQSQDLLIKVKEYFKSSFPQLYPKLIKVVSPVYANIKNTELLKAEELDNLPDPIILNLGSGCEDLGDKVINIDINPYETVHICASIDHLPFCNESVDIIISLACLEHVQFPEKVVKEMYRVLKPKGLIKCSIPFMQGIHGSPNDFQRYTPNGLITLFENFNVLEFKVEGGPTSGFLWILQEWLAIILSFGSVTLYWLWYFLGFILFPLKFLDVFYVKHPKAKNIASAFYIVLEKPK